MSNKYYASIQNNSFQGTLEEGDDTNTGWKNPSFLGI